MRSVILCLVLASSLLTGAQAIVQSKNCNTANTPSTTLTCAFTSNITAGNLIATTVTIYNFNETITATTTDGTNTYTIADTANQGLSPHAKTVGSYAKNVASGATTITITVSTATYIDVAIYEISGSDTSSPLDQHCQSSSTTSTGAPPVSTCSVTTTAANELILASIGADTTTAWASDGSYTLGEHIDNTSTNVMTFGDVFRVVSATNTFTPTVGGSGGLTNGKANVVMTFKAAATSSGTNTPAHSGVF